MLSLLLVCVLATQTLATDIGLALVLEYDDDPKGSTLVDAARLAVEEVNADPSLTQNQHRVVLTPRVVSKMFPVETALKNAPGYGSDSFDIHSLANDYYVYLAFVDAMQAHPQAAVIGPLHTVAMNLRVEATIGNLPMITPSPLREFEARDPSEPRSFVLQPFPTDSQHADFFHKVMESLGWERVAVIYTNDRYGVNGVQHFLSRCISRRVSVLGSFSFSPDKAASSDLRAALQKLQTRGARVFYLVAVGKDALRVLSAAAHPSLNMLGADYAWMVPGLAISDVGLLGPMFQKVLTSRPRVSRSAFEQWREQVWHTDASARYPTTGPQGADPSVLTAMLYDVAKHTAKALLSVADSIPEGGKQRLGGRWSGGQFVRDALKGHHEGVVLNVSLMGYRPERWDIEGCQLMWLDDRLSCTTFATGHGVEEEWGSMVLQLDLGVLTWGTNSRGVVIPYDRPALSEITVNVLASTRVWPFCHESVGRPLGVSGFACDIFTSMQSALGFKVNLTIGDFSDQELIAAVGNGSADVAIGHVVLHPSVTHVASSEERLRAFEEVEYTFPFWSDGIVAIGRKDETSVSTNIWHFVKPFHGELWGLWFAWMVFAGLVFFAFEWKNNDDLSSLPAHEALIQSMWFSFTASLACMDMAPRTPAGRIAAWSQYFLSMLLMAAYTANLAVFLVAADSISGPLLHHVGHTISTAEVGTEIASVPLRIMEEVAQGTYHESSDIDDLGWKLLNGTLRILAEEGPIADYLTNEWASKHNCELRTFGLPVGQLSYSFAVSRRWGYGPELSSYLVRVVAGEDVGKTSLERLYTSYFVTGKCSFQQSAGQTPEIGVHEMGGAFVCYIAAIGIAALVFVATTTRRAVFMFSTPSGVTEDGSEDDHGGVRFGSSAAPPSVRGQFEAVEESVKKHIDSRMGEVARAWEAPGAR